MDFHTHQSPKVIEEGLVKKMKHLVDERGRWRMTRLVQAERKPTVIQIITLYSCVEQKSIPEYTTRSILKQMGFQQPKTMLGSPVSQEQKTEAAVDTGSSKLDS